MPRTKSGKRLQALHEALEEIAFLRAENIRLHKVIAQTRRMQATSKYTVSIIAGFGRDWRSGYSNPVLSVPLQELFQEEQRIA